MGNSLAVQWSGPSGFTAKGQGSIPSCEAKIPQALGPKNFFNKK